MHSVATVSEWIRRIVGHEGESLSLHRTDRGNWTSGQVGVGELKGSKFGISAMSYPRLDIANLTLEQAADIYITDYLAPLGADRFADGVAYQLLDFAVNSGPSRAAKAIQTEIGVKADGVIGERTRAAVNARSETDLIMLVNAFRLNFLARQPAEWLAKFGPGLMNRMAENLRYGALDS